MKLLSGIIAAAALLTGCASVPMETRDQSDAAKKFEAPPEDMAGLYIYRSGSFGGALKKDVWVDGKCIGETGPNVFFYTLVTGGEEHKISTESEFSPNDLVLMTERGKNYFVQQYIKVGAFVGGAGVKLVTEETGKKALQKLKMASTGRCSK